MNASNKTLKTHPKEFIAELEKLGFKPGPWDSSNKRQLDLVNRVGYREARIVIDYEGEIRPHSVTLIRFNGQRNQLIEWEANHLPSSMPMGAQLAMIHEAVPQLKATLKSRRAAA